MCSQFNSVSSSQKEQELEQLARKERMASAGGQLIGAAFIGETFSQREERPQNIQMQEILKQRLSECLEKDEKVEMKMTIRLPDEAFLDNMARSLAQIMGVR